MKNRDMFYQNTQQSFMNPGMFVPPSGYNYNSEYQAFNPNLLPTNNQSPFNNQNDYEERISRLERQVKNLDNRLQKIENANTDTTDNFYMI